MIKKFIRKITISLLEKILPQRRLKIKFNCELPLTVISADSIYAAIAEGGGSNQ